MNSQDNLVYMINQIARNFATLDDTAARQCGHRAYDQILGPAYADDDYRMSRKER